MRSRRLALATIATLIALPGCVSPFHEHGADTRDVIARDVHDSHRKWDRYFLNFDWDDPYHDWHDESFASGPGHRH